MNSAVQATNTDMATRNICLNSFPLTWLPSNLVTNAADGLDELSRVA